MRQRLAQALCRLEELEQRETSPSPLHRIDGRAKLLVTIVYTVLLLSVPLTHLSEVLLFAGYPLLAAPLAGLRYGTLLRRSLIVVPFVAGIGLFNLFEAREPLFRIGPVAVSVGWVTFWSILLRGLLSLQALLLLIYATGYYRLCRALQQLGVPEPFTTQLLFVHRYLCLLLRESITLSMAREARTFGRHRYPLRTWGPLVGQLLLRTFDRAARIGQAMAARGFDGQMPRLPGDTSRWRPLDTLYVAVWCSLFAGLRLVSPERLF